ncbi:GGDEF domain-containing protein [Vibrio hippocampi]|nr:GGDEF domain-containing protein [Vibrio hippocampi]
MLFQRTQLRVSGLTMFAVAILGIGLGPMLIGLRGVVPDWASIVVGNLIILMAFQLNLYSLCIIRQYNKNMAFAVATGLPLVITFLVYFTTQFPSTRARVMIISFYLSTICITTAYVVYKGQRNDFKLAVNMLSGSFAFFGLYMLFRTIYTFLSAEIDDYMETGMVHQLTFLFSIILVVSISFSMLWLLYARLVQSIHELSYFDPLTKLRNRRALEMHVRKRFAGRLMRLKPMSIIMLDVDRFKRINDDCGHIVGDRVLRKVSEVIRQQINADATAFRFGGDEVMIVIDGANLDSAIELAETIRKQVLLIPQNEIAGQTVTCSFGVAQLNQNELWDSLVSRADKALYQAKEQGRNRVSDGDLLSEQPIAIKA